MCSSKQGTRYSNVQFKKKKKGRDCKPNISTIEGTIDVILQKQSIDTIDVIKMTD